MLVLTRRYLEAISIGPNADIEIKILDIGPNTVKIGIEAPKNIPVHRREIYERIQRENSTYCLDMFTGAKKDAAHEV